MLFVFDGFDEFPAEVHTKSYITDIISGSVYLPKATPVAKVRVITRNCAKLRRYYA